MSILRSEYNVSMSGNSDIPSDVSIHLLSDNETEGEFETNHLMIVSALHDIVKDQLNKIERYKRERRILKERIDTLKNLIVTSKDSYLINVVKYL